MVERKNPAVGDFSKINWKIALCRMRHRSHVENDRVGARPELPLAACGANDLAKQDLIFVERERLLREPVDRVITLVEAVNGNLFERLDVVEAGALAKTKQLVRYKQGERFISRWIVP